MEKVEALWGSFNNITNSASQLMLRKLASSFQLGVRIFSGFFTLEHARIAAFIYVMLWTTLQHIKTFSSYSPVL